MKPSASQKKSLKEIWDFYCNGGKKLGFAMMTGGGKTLIACHFIDKIKAKKKVLFVMRGQKLTNQTISVFKKHFTNDNVGLIWRNKKQVRPISVASIDTLLSNESLRKRVQEFYDFVIVDEAHQATASQFMEFLEGMNSRSLFLGLSATYGLNNKRAHTFWEKFLIGADGWQLLDEGRVPPLDQYSPPFSYSLDGVTKGSSGDWNSEELFLAVDKDTKLYGDIIKMYEKHGKNRPAIAFCINIKHLIKVKNLFISAGYNVCSFHSKQSGAEKSENNRKLKYFIKSKQSFVIVSVDMLSAGVDIPELEIGLMLRDTESENKFRQQVGRLTRCHPDKNKRVKLLDFTKNSSKYGHVYHMLEPVKKQKEKISKAPPLFRCKVCYFLSPKPFKNCPNCGADKVDDSDKRDFAVKHNEFIELVLIKNSRFKRDEIRDSLDNIANSI